jgi:hypothetical protein
MTDRPVASEQRVSTRARSENGHSDRFRLVPRYRISEERLHRNSLWTIREPQTKRIVVRCYSVSKEILNNSLRLGAKTSLLCVGLLISDAQDQGSNITRVCRRSKTRAKWRVLCANISRLFAAVRAGWCTTVYKGPRQPPIQFSHSVFFPAKQYFFRVGDAGFEPATSAV